MKIVVIDGSGLIGTGWPTRRLYLPGRRARREASPATNR